MGYGGSLIWTGLAYNLRRANPGKTIVFTYHVPFISWLQGKVTYPDFVIFDNNHDIDVLLPRYKWFFKKHHYPPDKTVVVNLHDPRYHYWTSDTPERITYKTGQHAIQFACDVHQILNAELKPTITLSPQEIAAADAILARHHLTPDAYLCLEPHTKDNYTPNKAWFWDRWEKLVQELTTRYPDIPLVQVGAPGSMPLPGTINLLGQTTFRATARILGQSRGLISCLGGLTHLNKAVGRRSVVLISAWEPKELASYPDDFNLYTDMDCQCAGLKTPCPLNRESMRRISVDDVLQATDKLIHMDITL